MVRKYAIGVGVSSVVESNHRPTDYESNATIDIKMFRFKGVDLEHSTNSSGFLRVSC